MVPVREKVECWRAALRGSRLLPLRLLKTLHIHMFLTEKNWLIFFFFFPNSVCNGFPKGLQVGWKRCNFMKRLHVELSGSEQWSDTEVEAGRRAAGHIKWKALHQTSGIPAFSSSFFCYSLGRVALFFSLSALSLLDLGTDKGVGGGGGETGKGWAGWEETMFLQCVVLL